MVIVNRAWLGIHSDEVRARASDRVATVALVSIDETIILFLRKKSGNRRTAVSASEQ